MHLFILIALLFTMISGCLDNQSPSVTTTSPTLTRTTLAPTAPVTFTTVPKQTQSIIGKYQATNDPTKKLEFRENGVLIIEGYSKYNQATWQKGDLDINLDHISDTKIIPGEGYVIKAHDTTCKPDQSPYLHSTGISTATGIFTNYEDCTIMEKAWIQGNKLNLLEMDWEKI